MGRKKEIEDSDLIKIIDTFFKEECNSNPRKLTLPAITAYINRNGHPNYRVESLRRTPTAREHIDLLVASNKETNQKIVSAYKTLDVETFLSVNKTRRTLIKALTELDTYYKSVVEAATRISKRNAELEKENETLKQEKLALEQTNNDSSDNIVILKNDLTQLKKENKKLRSLIKEYLYPEIANVLLTKEGLLKKEESIVDESALQNNLIKANTTINNINPDIKSNVIRNLFGDFDE